MQNKYYVYIYLNPTKPGNFNYGKYHFDYEPFYIGKGCNRRMYDHLSLRRKSFRTTKIKKLLKTYTKKELKQYIILQRFDMLECQAFMLEHDMIQTIGRRDLKQGPLTNLTDGGEGSSGRIYICSDETKKKLSESGMGKKLGCVMSKEAKLKMSRNHADINGSNNPMYKRKHSEESKRKMSETRKRNARLKKLLTSQNQLIILQTNIKESNE